MSGGIGRRAPAGLGASHREAVEQLRGLTGSSRRPLGSNKRTASGERFDANSNTADART
jgi:hypothetical protein